MQKNKKTFINLFLASVTAASVLSISAYADDKQKYPTLSEAPEITFVYDDGQDQYTSVWASWKNTQEFTDLTAEYSIDELEYAKSYGYEKMYFNVGVQIAYSLNGGSSWINDHDRPDDLSYSYASQIFIDGVGDWQPPSYWVTMTEVSDYFHVLYTYYYNEDKDLADKWANYVSQGTAKFSSTDGITHNYHVDLLGNDKLLLKARYVISGEASVDGEEFTTFNTYSSWSDIYKFGLDIDAEYLGFSSDGEYKAPTLNLMGYNGLSYMIKLTLDDKLRTFLAQYYAMDLTNEGTAPVYGDYSKYLYWFMDLKINDGNWFHYDYINANTVWDYVLSKDYLTEILLNKGIKLQPEDSISVRVRLLPIDQSELYDDSTSLSYYVPSEGCFAYTPVSNTITISPDGLYRISYDLNYGAFKYGATILDSYEETDNYILDLTQPDYIPEKEGYDFGGWYTTEDFKDGTRVTALDLSIKEYVHLYAKWVADEYTIDYDQVLSPEVYVVNSNPTIYTSKTPAEKLVLSDASSDGITFLGWYLSSDYSGSKVTAIDPAGKKNIKLYAKWDLPTYKITYELDNGVNATNPETFIINPSGEDARIKAPTKKGWLFDGWFYNKDYTGKLEYDSSKDEYIIDAISDITVYAKWIEGTAAISYVNIVDGSKSDLGFNNPNQAIYEYLTEVKLSDLSATGYRFDGWYTDEKCLTKTTGISKSDRGAKTFYAKWSELSYPVNYVLNQDSANSPALSSIKNSNPEARKYSATLILAAPECSDSNFTFSGWYFTPNLNGTPVDIIEGTTEGTLYAKWTKKASAEKPFIDVPVKSWYTADVLYVNEKGVMTGDANTPTFRPADKINRAEAAALLYKMTGSPAIKVTAAPFPDVPLKNWAATPITWAKANNIVTGYTAGANAGKFGRNDSIKRQDFIKMLYSYAKFKGLDVSVKDSGSYLKKSDAKSVSSYARVMVNWGYENEFIGKGNAKLNPKASISRSEVAAMVARFLRKYNL